MEFENSKEFALECDSKDPLRHFRDKFLIPKKASREVIYLCGNSLGLQPKTAKSYIQDELENWAMNGVEGHFHGERPWMPYHKNFKKYLGELVGAHPTEVVAMNSLTTNLHLMMATFYRPTGKRNKIICEAGAFPSDQYALETQAKFHGLAAENVVIEISPEAGEHNLSTDQILNAIVQTGDELALVMFSGVQYYTGQFFDIAAITKKAHEVGAIAGFDLAHAVGNLPLKLNQWDVDFAVWCSYKYLNSGPGAVGGAFVNEKHHQKDLPQFGGWWGHNEAERFKMEKGFKPMQSVDRWQLSNAPVLNMAAHLASLEIYSDAGIDNLRAKSLELTGYLEFLLRDIGETAVEIITPTDPNERGCQLSLFINRGGKDLFKRITEKGVIADWREPNVIRIAPVPLYNSFDDVWQFSQILQEELKSSNNLH
ncbi:MAG: kynureninase [Cyclobacteriaceae bacterium]